LKHRQRPRMAPVSARRFDRTYEELKPRHRRSLPGTALDQVLIVPMRN